MGGTFGKVPDVGWLKSVQMKAVEMGGNWGTLSAAFSGFTSVSTIVRGRYAKRCRTKPGKPRRVSSRGRHLPTRSAVFYFGLFDEQGRSSRGEHAKWLRLRCKCSCRR